MVRQAHHERRSEDFEKALACCHCEYLPLILSPSKDHPELVEGGGNLDEAEHTATNRRCYGDEIANPRIEYGVAMTKWVCVSNSTNPAGYAPAYDSV